MLVFYSVHKKKLIMKKFLLFAIILTTAIASIAQSPTIVTASSSCSVFRNFNLSAEGFSSPSIYSDGNDLAFYWDGGAGAEIENSGVSGSRTASLISPVYVQSDPGVATVGFRYIVPLFTEYRIRVISSGASGPLEVIATTANGSAYSSMPGTSGNICLLLTDADLTVGRQVRFEFTFRAIVPGNLLFDDMALSVSGGPLPVTFEGFVARKNNDASVKLLWNVGQENNVKGYYVESSTNGTDFTTGGYVTATGKSIYSFDYPGKIVQTTYFRVKNIDFNGSSKYTTIIKVYANTQSGAPIQIYPMPAKEQVTVQHSEAGINTVINLYTVDGILLQSVNAAAHSFQTQLNTGTLAKGVYIVRFNDGKENVQSVKMIKN